MYDINQIVTQQKLGTPILIKLLEKDSERNFLVKTTTGEFVFSFYQDDPRFRTLTELNAHQELNDHLLKNKFPVAKILSASKSNYEKTNILIKKYIHGRAKSTPTKNELMQFAKLFGQFHKLTKDFKTKNKIQHRWDLKTTRRHVSELQKLFPNDKFLPHLKKKLASIKISEQLPSGMIHEDLGKRHVLWDKNKITGFIDFERSYYAPLVYDLGQVLRGWCFHSNWTKWCNKKLANILQNYSTQRKITEAEKKYLFDALKFAIIERALSFYLKFLYHNDKDARSYALHSLNYLLPLIEKKKTKIQSIINPPVREQGENAA